VVTKVAIFSKEFLSGNLVSILWMDVESNTAADKYLVSADVNPDGLPLVVLKDGTWMSDPSLPELAQRIGFSRQHLKNV